MIPTTAVTRVTTLAVEERTISKSSGITEI